MLAGLLKSLAFLWNSLRLTIMKSTGINLVNNSYLHENQCNRSDVVDANLEKVLAAVVSGSSVSVVFLGAMLMTFGFFSELRSFGSKLQTMVAITLIFRQIMLVAVPLMIIYVPDLRQPRAYQIVGTVYSLAYSSAYCSINACAFHMCRTFSKPFAANRDCSNRQLVPYIVYTVALPIVLTATRIIYTIYFNPFYWNKEKCRLSHDYTIDELFQFVPFLIVQGVNILLLILTICAIQKVPRLTRNARRQRVFVYLKLFVLISADGVFFVINVVVTPSEDSDDTAYFVVVGLTQGFMGISFFICFVCNHRVFNLYRKLCCKAKRPLTDADGVRLSMDPSVSTIAGYRSSRL